MLARLLAWTLAPLLACGGRPCPEVAAPATPQAASPDPVPVVVHPPAPPTCTLTRSEASARANALLAKFAGSARADQLPPGFHARPCESHCLARGARTSEDVPCDGWDCRYLYGGARLTFFTTAPVTVEVIRCGEQVFMTERVDDCLRKPHRCRFVVDRATAETIARERGKFFSDSLVLRWDPAAGEFQWIADLHDENYEDTQSLRISTHERGKTWTEDLPPRTQ